MQRPFFFGNQLAHTFSVVARDPKTGELGVAVQSHWFSVGSVVSWAEAGVGAVATQSMVEVSFGPRGLDLLREGHSARQALDALLDDDPGREVRQLAIVDATGRVATHTGSSCIPMAGHEAGAGFSVQANMMLTDRVWPDMAEAYRANKDLPLPERLVAVLEAAQAAGGDIRGKQSAALLVVRAAATGKVWQDRLIDLRVEDHPEPIPEIRRLLRVHRAYEHMNRGDVALEEGDTEAALDAYSTARAMFPDNAEMTFWHGVSLANVGRVDESLPLFEAAFAADDNWRELARRLVPGEFLMVSEDDLARILGVGA
jgi:uncharacterized Ntn-hydrolase superfamily protein